MGDGGGSDASRNWSIGEWAIYKTMLPFAADFPFCSLATPLQLRTTNNQQPTTPSITECPCGLIGLSLSPGHNRSKSGHLIPFFCSHSSPRRLATLHYFLIISRSPARSPPDASSLSLSLNGAHFDRSPATTWITTASHRRQEEGSTEQAAIPATAAFSAGCCCCRG